MLPTRRRSLLKAILATSVIGVPLGAHAWVHGGPLPTNILQNWTRNIGYKTNAGQSSVPLSNILIAPGFSSGAVVTWDVTQIGGTAGHYQGAGTGLAASASTPTPSATGHTANLNGGPYVFTCVAKNAGGGTLGTCTLTMNTVTQATRAAWTRIGGAVTAASEPGNPVIAAMAAQTVDKAVTVGGVAGQIYTISSAAEYAAYNNTASSNAVFLVSYGCAPFLLASFAKVPAAGTRCFHDSELGPSAPAAPQGNFYSTLQLIQFQGNSVGPVLNVRCEAWNLLVATADASGKNGERFFHASDCVIGNSPVTGPFNKPSSPYWTAANTRNANGTSAGTLAANFPQSILFDIDTTDCYVSGGSLGIYQNVNGIWWKGTNTRCCIDGVIMRNFGPDGVLVGSNNGGPIVDCYYYDMHQIGPVCQSVGHPDTLQFYGQPNPPTITRFYVSNCCQVQADGTGDAQGTPFLGSPLVGQSSVFNVLGIRANLSMGITSKGFEVANVTGLDAAGFTYLRQMAGVTGGLNSPQAPNTSPYNIAHGAPHDWFGGAQGYIVWGEASTASVNPPAGGPVIGPTWNYSSGTEQLYPNVNFSANNVPGSIASPTCNPAAQIVINGVTVTLNGGSGTGSFADIQASINAAGISHITASSTSAIIAGKLVLMISNSQGDAITLADGTAGILATLGLPVAGTYGGWSGSIVCGFSHGPTSAATPTGLTRSFFNFNKTTGSTTPPDYGNPNSQSNLTAYFKDPSRLADYSQFAFTVAGCRALLAYVRDMNSPLPAGPLDGAFGTPGDGTWNAGCGPTGKPNQYGQVTLGFTGLPASDGTGATVNGVLNLVGVFNQCINPYTSGVLPTDVICNIAVNGTPVAGSPFTIAAGSTSVAFSFTKPSVAAIVTADNDVGLLNVSQTVN